MESLVRRDKRSFSRVTPCFYYFVFVEQVSTDQARYLEALALRATRLGGNVTNLKEEKVIHGKARYSKITG